MIGTCCFEILGVNHLPNVFWIFFRLFLHKWTIFEMFSLAKCFRKGKLKYKADLPWNPWNFSDLINQLPIRIFLWKLAEDLYGSVIIPNLVSFRVRLDVQSRSQNLLIKPRNFLTVSHFYQLWATISWCSKLQFLFCFLCFKLGLQL